MCLKSLLGRGNSAGIANKALRKIRALDGKKMSSAIWKPCEYSRLTWLYGLTSTESSSLVTCVIMDVLSIYAFQTQPKLSIFSLQWVFICFSPQNPKFALNRTVTKLWAVIVPGAFDWQRMCPGHLWLDLMTLIFSIFDLSNMHTPWNLKPPGTKRAETTINAMLTPSRKRQSLLSNLSCHPN